MHASKLWIERYFLRLSRIKFLAPHVKKSGIIMHGIKIAKCRISNIYEEKHLDEYIYLEKKNNNNPLKS